MLLPKNLFIVVFTCFLFLACTDTNDQTILNLIDNNNIHLDELIISKISDRYRLIEEENYIPHKNYLKIDSLYYSSRLVFSEAKRLEINLKDNKTLNSLDSLLFNSKLNNNRNELKKISSDKINLLINLEENRIKNLMADYLINEFYINEKPISTAGKILNKIKTSSKDNSSNEIYLKMSNLQGQFHRISKVELKDSNNKKVKFKIEPDYSFAKIIIKDSLSKGKNKLKGHIYYKINNHDLIIPFEKEIEIK